MKNKYLAAFTLLELITVLVLSTIIIGMAYTAYELIYKDFTDYKSKNETALATLDFITTLENDITIADSLKMDEYRIEIHQKNRIILYELYPENTLRFLSKNESIIDTFDYEIRNFEINNQALFLEYRATCIDCSEPTIVRLIDFEIAHLNNRK